MKIPSDATDWKYLELCQGTFGTNGDNVHSTFHYDRLSAFEKLTYTRIRWAIMERKPVIKIPCRDPQEGINVLDKVLLDNPLLFWIKDAYAEHRYETTQIFLKYDDALWDNRFFYLDEIHKIYAIIKEEIEPESSDYDIELLVHDALSNTVKYFDKSGREHSIVDVLVSGRGVCDAISYAMCYLLLMMGVECSIMPGSVKKSNKDVERHAWNIVKIDDSWYHVDATWDLKYSNTVMIHRFFNLNDDMMELTHNFERGLCHSLQHNYYVKNKTVFNNMEDIRKYVESKKTSTNVIEFFATWSISESEMNSLNLAGWKWWEDSNCYVLYKS